MLSRPDRPCPSQHHGSRNIADMVHQPADRLASPSLPPIHDCVRDESVVCSHDVLPAPSSDEDAPRTVSWCV